MDGEFQQLVALHAAGSAGAGVAGEHDAHVETVRDLCRQHRESVSLLDRALKNAAVSVGEAVPDAPLTADVMKLANDSNPLLAVAGRCGDALRDCHGAACAQAHTAQQAWSSTMADQLSAQVDACGALLPAVATPTP